MAIEQLDELGEVRQRAGQAVDLVNDDDIDLCRLSRRPIAAAGQGGRSSHRNSPRHRSGSGSGSSRHGPDCGYRPARRHAGRRAS